MKNIKIKKAFLDAGGKISTRNLTSNPVQIVENYELWNDRIELFADKILLESISCIERASADTRTLDDWDAGYQAGLCQAINEIKIHFGLK